MIVGAPGPNGGARRVIGQAYFYLGSRTGLSAAPLTYSEPSITTGTGFGQSVSSAGDVNGDGYPDVLIGAPSFSGGIGQTYYYPGSSDGLVTSPTALGEPTAPAGTGFGASVAEAGDIDGDGYGDILIGAPNGQGRAYLWRGNQAAARAGALRLYNTNYTPISTGNRGVGQFGIGLTARNAAGRIQARLVWEVVGQGQSFSNAAALPNSVAYTGRGAWTDLPASGTAVELRALVTKAGRTSKVRARLEYAGSPLTTGPANGTGGVASRARYGPWTYVAAQQAGVSAAAATPLPVELSAFTATPAGPAAVRLAWATASEKNSASFEVERSPDGKTFARIGTVAAAGSSSSTRGYELLDTNLPTHQSTIYYRLRQLDADGTFAYSPVRVVPRPGAGAAGPSLYPNPARGGAATLTGTLPGTVVTVTDALGRPVTSTIADASGTAALDLPAGLPTGVYLVRVGSQALRLTIE